MKALNGFLMIQRQITLKVHSVRKLHQPRMWDGFLADNLDTTLTIVYICSSTQLRGSVKCTIS